MAAPKSVWGIDIGQCALKALKLVEVDGQLRAEASDIIEHPQVLSAPDADRDQLVRNSLEEFLSRNDLSDSQVAIAVPGQTSFTRFVKMPPVDPKKIPELVRFEAEQQIPFDISEVIWRWQAFDDPDSPDVEVGLFAMKRADVYAVLDPFTEMDTGVDFVQMAPLALYNFMTYDQQTAGDGATLLVDIGANGTDLVVSDGSRLWTRTIQLGGNNFTESLVKAFKLSFSKAEKLKRTAATSKYARQVFQAMRPVFADLVQEIQRSIGYYTSLHREAKFTRIIGVGNGFRLPGLQKFIQQNLNTPVLRLDSFNALQPSEAISAPQFTENVLGFAVAYGLAVQGLELTRIDTNLLPNEIASARRWAKKRSWFVAAAMLLVVATAARAWRANRDYGILRPDQRPTPAFSEAQKMIREYTELRNVHQQYDGQAQNELRQIDEMMKIRRDAKFWPLLVEVINQSIRTVARDQQLMDSINVEKLTSIDPKKRGCLVMQKLESEYLSLPDGAKAQEALLDPGVISGANQPGAVGYAPMGGASAAAVPGTRGVRLVLTGRCPRDRAGTRNLLNALAAQSRKLFASIMGDEVEVVAAKFVRYRDPLDDLGGRTGRGGGGAGGGMGMGTGMGGGAYGGPAYGGGAYGAAGGDTVAGPTGPTDVTGMPIQEQTGFQIGWVLRIKPPAAPTATP